MTSSHPPATKYEQEAAARQQRPIVSVPVGSIELKWGVTTVHTPEGALIFKDLQGQRFGAKGMYALASWDWANPRPESGVVNRHGYGLDPVDWKSFSQDCKLFVISRGVTSDILVRFEQVHRVRDAFGGSMVLVLDSALAVDVINQLLASNFDEGLCFLIHSTC